MNFQMKNHIRPINNNIKHSTAYLWTTSPIIPGNIKTKRNVLNYYQLLFIRFI